MITIKENSKTVEFTIELPKKYGKPVEISDEEFRHQQQRRVARMMDIIGAFSSIIIESLERRMRACEMYFIENINSIDYNDGGHISYLRKDGSAGSFNIPSYEGMRDCIKALKQSCFKEFLGNKLWIDQVIKALLNDPELDLNRCSKNKGFRFSELTSILCELHAAPQIRLDF